MAEERRRRRRTKWKRGHGGGGDVNGGQGRHVESVSLIFAENRRELFLRARALAR